MNSTFASSYELLLSAISELELQKDSFVLHPGVDFSRKRKISFRDTILSLLTHGIWKKLGPLLVDSGKRRDISRKPVLEKVMGCSRKRAKIGRAHV